MNPCHRFEIEWQDHLDARHSSPLPGDQPAWVGHLALCAGCRETDRRFRMLGTALDAWSLAAAETAPVPGLSDRVVAAWREEEVLPLGARPLVRRIGRLALAACLLIAGGLVVWRMWPGSSEVAPVAIAVGEPPARPLVESVAEVSATSVEIARATSDSAGRLGQQLIGSVLPDTPTLPETAIEPTRLIRTVGQRVDSGVRPIARTALRAFDFLVPFGNRTARATPRGA